MFLTLFEFLTLLLTSKHPTRFSKFLLGNNGTMWKTCFSAPRNAKKIRCNKKTSAERTFYWQWRLRIWRIILVIKWWAHKTQWFTIISIKIMRIWKFLFKSNRVFYTRKPFQICKFVIMSSGKWDLRIHFSFLQEF